MKLSTNRVLKINQSEIEEAILNLVFKRKPDLRPNGTDRSDPPQISFQISENTGVTATIILENKNEEVINT